jgi:hypothetical protein
MTNPWRIMTRQDGQVMEDRKEKEPAPSQVALNGELIRPLIRPHLPKNGSTPVLDLGGRHVVYAKERDRLPFECRSALCS